jgi:hypothetical protein
MLEAVPGCSHADLEVMAPYPYVRSVPRLRELIPRRRKTHSSVIADFEPDLPYLHPRCIAHAFVLQIAQDAGGHVSSIHLQGMSIRQFTACGMSMLAALRCGGNPANPGLFCPSYDITHVIVRHLFTSHGQPFFL